MTIVRMLAVEKLSLVKQESVEAISRLSVSVARTDSLIINGSNPENYKASRKIAA